jgi:tetratricopeptide (TPR) repeat protein
MRAVIYASCLVLALAGQQKPADLYASAIAKYAAGDDDGAFEAIARVPHEDIQKDLEATLRAIEKIGGSPAARRRLETAAMLHTDYALNGDANPKDVLFHVDMAHLSLAISRWSLTGRVPETSELDVRRAREFLSRWYGLASSVLLTYAADQNATTLVDEGLKLLPEDGNLLFWRGLVLEFHAVWVGTPVTDPRAAVPAIRHTDGSGFDLLANTRVWGPAEEAYRRVLQKSPDHFEAHLHHAYTLYSLRRYSDAKPEYELARDRSPDPFVVYVADLLLARLAEDQNDLQGAVQHYEHALATMAGAQDAYVGLGSVEARLGHAQRARELTEKLAAIPEKRRVRDPWWGFHTTRVPADDLHWLRAAVRQ